MAKCILLASMTALALVNAAPATIVTAEFLGPRNGQVGLGGPTNNAGQTFTPLIEGPFSSLDLFLRRNGADPVTLTVSLWNVDGTGLPTGAPLAESSLLVTLTEEWEWYTLDFSASGFVLDAGVQYAWTTRSESGDGGYMLGTRTGNNYDGGRGIIKLGSNWVFMGGHPAIGERDALFVARVVPAPGATGALLAGFAFVTRRRRTS